MRTPASLRHAEGCGFESHHPLQSACKSAGAVFDIGNDGLLRSCTRGRIVADRGSADGDSCLWLGRSEASRVRESLQRAPSVARRDSSYAVALGGQLVFAPAVFRILQKVI
jgi:hypothetical protein